MAQNERMGASKTKSSPHHSGAGKILVGTASWSDPGFVQHWYPKGMRAHERLGWYAQQFEMVEVNSTFYSVPICEWLSAGVPPRPIGSRSM